MCAGGAPLASRGAARRAGAAEGVLRVERVAVKTVFSEVPCPDADARHVDRVLESLLHFARVVFGNRAVPDVHADADHAQRRSIGRALHDTAALEQPAPLAATRADAIFRVVVIRAAGNVRREAALRLADIVAVDIVVPALHVVSAIAGLDIEPLAPVVVPAGPLDAEVELPQPDLRAPQRRFESCFAAAQLELGLLLRLDIERDADRNGRIAFEIPFADPAAILEPAIFARGDTDAVLDFERLGAPFEMVADGAFDALCIVGMQPRVPGPRLALPLLALVSRHRKPHGAARLHIARDVPVPERGASAPQRGRELRFLLLQHHLGPLACIDLDADAGRAKRPSCFVELDHLAALQEPHPA